MKVVLVGEFPVVAGGSVGGVQAVALALAGEFAKRDDVELHVVAFQHGIAEEGIATRDGYHLHLMPASPRGGLVTQGRGDRRRLQRKFSEIVPDVIHANQAGIHALAALDSGFPIVMTVHGIYWWLSKALYGNGVKGRIRRALFDRVHISCLKRVRHVILISPYVWKELGHLSDATTYRIDNPVDAVYFEHMPASEENRLLFVGLISRRKGVDCLLRAFRLVLASCPEARLEIIGKTVEPEFRQELVEYVDSCGLGEAVHWRGSMDRVSLAAEYAAASMLVLPSTEETAPCVVSEAMAAGCPVVASRVGGIPDMVDDGHSGLLVDPHNHEALAEAILRLLGDRPAREGMSKMARESALERYAPWSVAAKTVEVYRRVIEIEAQRKASPNAGRNEES